MKMYERQHKDNLEFWHMQNSYNSPQEQMKRLQEGGLNPNLVYGSGSPQGQASPVSTPDVKPVNHRFPQAQDFNFLAQYFDSQIKQAQVDNLKVDNAVKLEDAMLKEAQRKNTEAQTGRSIYDLKFDKSLESVYADMKREQVRGIKASTTQILDENERRAAMNGASLKESAQRVLNLRAKRAHTKSEISKVKQTVKNLKSTNALMKLDIELKKNGIQPSDALYMRILGRLLGEFDIKKFRN